MRMKHLRPLVGFTVLAFLVAGGAGVTSASADQVMCTNDVPTMFAAGGVTRGTSGDDVIMLVNRRVTSAQHIVYGLGGNDVICGSVHADKIFGGSGDDLIYGGRGNDTVIGGAGHDTVYGEAGRDKFTDRTDDDGWAQN